MGQLQYKERSDYLGDEPGNPWAITDAALQEPAGDDMMSK